MLHVPHGGSSFGLTLPSWGTTRPAAANGTSVTPAVGSKGSWAQLGSDLVDDTYGLLININSNSASAASRNTVVDIGVDEAGGTSYSVVIADLLAGGAPTYAVGAGGLWYYFPLFIPSGSAVAARSQGSVTTAHRVGVVHMQRPARTSATRIGAYAETLGITAPAGTSITPGTTSEGSWTSIGTTSKRLWWWQVGLQVTTGDTAWNAGTIHVDLAVGDATNKDIIIKDAPVVTSTAEALSQVPYIDGVEWDVPGGSTMYMRAQHSGTLDAYTAAVYGVGG